MSRDRSRRLKYLARRVLGRAPAATSREPALELFPPGHYYSPVPDTREVLSRREQIFDRSLRDLPGVDLDVAGQLALLERLKRFYPQLPFTAAPAPGLRYHYENDWYSYSDAIFTHCMIRDSRPRRVVEVGAGFSSLLILDTNERFFDGAIRCTFIDPDCGRLRAGLKEGDAASVEVVERHLQDVGPEPFAALAAGDVLLIDSSHVVKVGSDVLRIVFDILPALAPGVLIHVHDVFYPFEYPEDWVRRGHAWSEAYLLRAFLQYNQAFEVRLWNHFLALFHADALSAAMPLCLRNPGGSLWLRRVEARGAT